MIKQRKITGSFTNFEHRYDPVIREDGQLIREWNDPTLNGVPEDHIWTIVDCDGKLILVPGYATVNYFGRVLCRNPWGPDEEFNTGYNYA